MLKRKLHWMLLPVLVMVSLPAFGQTELQKSVASAGGGRAGDGTHRIVCSVGQPCVGIMASANHRHLIGFLAPGVFVVSDVDDGMAPPNRMALAQNYPNPFGPTTTIRFDLPDSRRVRLEVFSLQGRKVATLIDKAMTPGRFTVLWDGRDAGGRSVASGVYLYRLTAGDFRATNRMVLTR
ncbi:MAG: T9SS type A sorting domain-containing protein [Candidatus Eisenbacteria bacterium]|nr:T9SS type A sorting domain-containing protein [Candidatus Eisenbacteria bacterium]